MAPFPASLVISIAIVTVMRRDNHLARTVAALYQGDANQPSGKMMKRYLVTGGCGFIGSHLTMSLRDAGHAVRVLDDLSSGLEANLPPGVELLVGDVTDPAMVAHAVRGIDGCFHLAAIASVERGTTDWLGTHRVNLTGTITLFDALRGSPPARPVPVVYASSAAVYGNAAIPPVAETFPCRPASAYGADKYGCELHGHVAAHVHGIPNTGLRFFNVYGPRQDPRSPYSGAISIFCDRLLRGAPVCIFGDGAQTRDFIYVADVVTALDAAMRRLAGRSEVTAEVFNICTGRPASIQEVANIIAGLCGRTARFDFRPPRAGEIRHSHGNPDLALATLGIAARTSLQDGLRETLEWLRATAAV